MADERPLTAEEVLAREFAALRPGSEDRPGDAADHFRKVHRAQEPLAAICISGGGIRSATFALGALQGLAAQGLLPRFDYLSTVSGGGYIGSWMRAWAHRVGGIARIVPSLASGRRDAELGEGDPIHHLREYNSYLAPKRGAFSTDAWTLVAIVVRNILLNWMVILPILLFVLLVPRFVLSLFAYPELRYASSVYAHERPDYSAPALDVISNSVWVSQILPMLSVLLFGVALLNIMRCLPGLGGRDHSEADFRRLVMVPLVGAVFTFLLFDSYYFLGSKFTSTSNLPSVVIWAAIPAFGAWLLYIAIWGQSLARRARLLFSPLSLAVLSMVGGLGLTTWISTNYLLWSPNPDNEPSWAEYVTTGPSLILFGFCFGTTLFLGLSSGFLHDDDREWMSRAIARVLLFAVTWAILCALVLIVPGWVLSWESWAHGLAGAATALAGWLSSRGDRGDQDSGKPSTAAKMLAVASKLAPPIFLALLVVGLSIATNALLVLVHGFVDKPLNSPLGDAVAITDHHGIVIHAHPLPLMLLAALLLAFAWLAARFINVNLFSLHGMYRDRLIRAYLGASNPRRHASRFTDFAASDDLPLASLDPAQRPMPVVNLTLNLVGGSRLDWQQRKAQGFTATPIACGSADLGYRPTAEYAGGLSLGSALAISGAAASPNMGYYSSPLVAFIMTLFNARLGAWLGNPGPAGEKTWRHPGPRAAIRMLTYEALGLTTNESEYVYLSDGGHFENLGLYEMVRRRCRTLVVFDGSADPTFSLDGLGDALRKIRIDLGIPIEFGEEGMAPLRRKERRCAVGRVRYSAVDGPCEDGRLIYVKPLLLGCEAPDISSFAARFPDFPHQSTADQFFDESQTESYRMLGQQTMAEIARGCPPGSSLEVWGDHVERVYLGGAPDP